MISGLVASLRLGTGGDDLGELADIGQLHDTGSDATMTRWRGLFRLLFAQGSYEQMVTVGQALAQAGRTAGNGNLEAFGDGVQGAGLIRQGQLTEGTALMEQSMQPHSMRIASVERAAMAQLARLDVLEGRPQDAVTRLQPFIASDLTWDYSVTLWAALAAAYLELEDLRQARWCAGLAVAEARRTGAWLHGISALEVQGMVQARHGEHDLAQDTYQEGLRRARAMPFRYGEAWLLHAQGLLDRQQGNEAAATAKLSDALAIVQTLGAERDAIRIREAM